MTRHIRVVTEKRRPRARVRYTRLFPRRADSDTRRGERSMCRFVGVRRWIEGRACSNVFKRPEF